MTARNVIDQWSFVETLNMMNVNSGFHLVRAKFHNIKLAIENSTSHKREFFNSYHLALILERNITAQAKEVSSSLILIYNQNN